jgi:hypothetical protein
MQTYPASTIIARHANRPGRDQTWDLRGVGADECKWVPQVSLLRPWVLPQTSFGMNIQVS